MAAFKAHRIPTSHKELYAQRRQEVKNKLKKETHRSLYNVII